jgi:predicted RNA-binding protein with PIN domain
MIDGFNVIRSGSTAALFDPTDIDSASDYLISRLSDYRKIKRIAITVVYDATDGISLTRKTNRLKGIELIYSKRGETADQVIIEAIRHKTDGLVVVSSDRAIIDEAKRHGVAFITPGRLEDALDGDSDDDYPDKSEKKGNPRKAPKNLRKARRAIKKI